MLRDLTINNEKKESCIPITKIVELALAYKEEIFGGTDMIGVSVYDTQETQIGSVYDILVDETDHIRYLVIDTGAWVFGRKVLLPVGLVGMNDDQHRVFVRGLTKELVESLPRYQEKWSRVLLSSKRAKLYGSL